MGNEHQSSPKTSLDQHLKIKCSNFIPKLIEYLIQFVPQVSNRDDGDACYE